jgi:hypothetical protein
VAVLSRSSVQTPFYDVTDERSAYRPGADPVLRAVTRFDVEGAPIELTAPVTWTEPTPPYGDVAHVLAVLPALGVTVAPGQAIVPLNAAGTHVTLTVDIVNNRDGEASGELRLELPQTWTADPPSRPFRFERSGERQSFAFRVAIPSLENREYRIEAAAVSGGRETATPMMIAHRDLRRDICRGTRSLQRPRRRDVHRAGTESRLRGWASATRPAAMAARRGGPARSRRRPASADLSTSTPSSPGRAYAGATIQNIECAADLVRTDGGNLIVPTTRRSSSCGTRRIRENRRATRGSVRGGFTGRSLRRATRRSSVPTGSRTPIDG